MSDEIAIHSRVILSYKVAKTLNVRRKSQELWKVKGKDEVVRNFASRMEKTSLKDDCVVIFFCGSRNRRLASDKNLSLFSGGSKH